MNFNSSSKDSNAWFLSFVITLALLQSSTSAIAQIIQNDVTHEWTIKISRPPSLSYNYQMRRGHRIRLQPGFYSPNSTTTANWTDTPSIYRYTDQLLSHLNDWLQSAEPVTPYPHTPRQNVIGRDRNLLELRSWIALRSTPYWLNSNLPGRSPEILLIQDPQVVSFRYEHSPYLFQWTNISHLGVDPTTGRIVCRDKHSGRPCAPGHQWARVFARDPVTQNYRAILSVVE